MTLPLFNAGIGRTVESMHWRACLDGDDGARTLFDRHYSRRRYADGRKPRLFVGPGQKTVLVTEACDALFVWRKFIDASGQEGVNCAVFRNEGSVRSSLLILEAEVVAWQRWPGERLYTYVNGKTIRSTNPGACFKFAGWRRCGTSKDRGLAILEKLPHLNGQNVNPTE